MIVLEENLFDPTRVKTGIGISNSVFIGNANYYGSIFSVTPGEVYNFRRSTPYSNRFIITFSAYYPVVGGACFGNIAYGVVATNGPESRENVVVPANAKYMTLFLHNTTPGAVNLTDITVTRRSASKGLMSYSVQEDATPTNLSDAGAGGFGQLNYTRRGERDDELRLERNTTIKDSKWGSFQGVVRDISSDDDIVSIVADSALSKLSRWYTVPPFTGTLAAYLTMLSGITGVTLYTNTTRTGIVAPGFVGNVWDGLRDFLTANRLEIAQVGSTIMVRELRTFNSYYNYNTTESWQLNSQSTAEKLKVYWSDIKKTGSNIEVFSPESEFSVDFGEIVEQELTLPVSLSSVNQPTCVDYVPANIDYSGTSGVYCVAGKDGKPITAAQWTNTGGKVIVKLTDDPSTIKVTIIGSSDQTYAPYKIAATAGTNSFYNALHITGNGMSWERNSIEVYTGAPRSSTSAETSIEIDSRNITSLAQAYTAAICANKAYCGSLRTISGTSVSLNRPEDRPNQLKPLISDFNLTSGVTTIESFNTKYSGNTIQIFNSTWESSLSSTLENQAFGQVIGARALRDKTMYRVESLTTGPNNMSYTLSNDTLFGDFNGYNNLNTIADFNAAYAGKRFMDFNNASLTTQGG